MTRSQFSHGQIYIFTQGNLSMKWNSQHERSRGQPNRQQRQQQQQQRWKLLLWVVRSKSSEENTHTNINSSGGKLCSAKNGPLWPMYKRTCAWTSSQEIHGAIIGIVLSTQTTLLSYFHFPSHSLFVALSLSPQLQLHHFFFFFAPSTRKEKIIFRPSLYIFSFHSDAFYSALRSISSHEN